MSDELSAFPGETPLARRPHGPNDGWVEGPDGSKYWGREGAAGLLVIHPELGVLLQLRAIWSHFGGTWGLPGGAINVGETATEAAIREANEEAGVPPELLEPLFTSVVDLGYWSYTTVVATARERFAPVVGDAESIELRWVPVAEVTALPLHPGFAASWPALQQRLAS
jgi:8-oxo-dGTP pyrophosphatase MutT (NUDIX family)